MAGTAAGAAPSIVTLVKDLMESVNLFDSESEIVKEDLNNIMFSPLSPNFLNT